jgi:hypothetical protein
LHFGWTQKRVAGQGQPGWMQRCNVQPMRCIPRCRSMVRRGARGVRRYPVTTAGSGRGVEPTRFRARSRSVQWMNRGVSGNSRRCGVVRRSVSGCRVTSRDNRVQRLDNDSPGARVARKSQTGVSGRIAAFCFGGVPAHEGTESGGVTRIQDSEVIVATCVYGAKVTPPLGVRSGGVTFWQAGCSQGTR